MRRRVIGIVLATLTMVGLSAATTASVASAGSSPQGPILCCVE